jgi:hypothetical protein
VANFLRGKNLARWGDDAEHLHRWSSRQFLELLRGYGVADAVRFAFPWVIVRLRWTGD